MLPRLYLVIVPPRRTCSWSAGMLAASLLTLGLAGCTLIETPSVAANSGLSWFSNLTAAPAETVNNFDLELLRPVAQQVDFGPESLLEVTVWDLFEPDKPHTFPVRVGADQTIDAPMLEPLSIQGRSLAQIENALGEAYKSKELLLNPRILVRSLDESTVRVTVAGAVARPGTVTLTRQDASVHAAVLAAGGFKKDAGMHVGITRRDAKDATVADLPEDAAQSDPAELVSSARALVKTASAETDSTATESKSVDSANAETDSAEAVTAESDPAGPDEDVAQEGQESSTIVARRVPTSQKRGAESSAGHLTWYDLTRSADRERLKSLSLAPGDTLTVRPTQRPVRIAGAVAHPGAYALPANQTVNVWQALEMAGGVTATNTPLRVTLIRPGVARSGLRYTLNVKSYDQHPQTAPPVHEGDMLQVEATVEGRVKNAVGGLWKP